MTTTPKAPCTYLVTGGCGFIGSHLVEELAGQGHRLRVLDDLSSGYEHNLADIEGEVVFQRGDIRDRAAVRQAVEGADYVFHEAALVSVFDSVERPLDTNAVNVTGTLNVLEACRQAGVRRVVLASSSAVYGDDPQLPKVESLCPEPASPYAASKTIGEYYARIYHDLYGLETVALRYFNVYGPRQDPTSMYSGVISKYCAALAAGERPTVFGDGLQTRDFIYVKDVVRANLLAMHAGAAGRGEVFNVGTGRQVSLLDLLESLSSLSGRPSEPVFKPMREGDIRDSRAGIERAAEVLGFSPVFDLEEGLRVLWEAEAGGHPAV